ncbi:MAG: type II secretion system F family protein [Puniceicoccaceae bacterium]
MPQFQFTALDRQGVRSSGTLEAPDQSAASRQLAGRGLTPLSLQSSGISPAKTRSRVRPKPSPSQPAAPVPQASPPRRNRKAIRPKRLPAKSFRRFLSLALRLHEGGYSIGDTIKVLRTRLGNPEDLAFAEDVWAHISEGRGFSDSLALAGAPVPDSLIQMIRAGEATGNLAPVLRDLLDYLENLDSVRREVLGSMAYPAALVLFTLGVGGFLVGYLMPIIQGMVSSMGGELSIFSRILSTFTEVIVKGFPIFLSGIAIGVLAFILVRRSEAGLLQTDRLLLQIPTIGKLIRLLDLYRLSGLLASLIRNGVSTAEALVLTEPAIRNTLLRQSFQQTRDAVFEGAPISRTMSHLGLLDPVEGDLLGASEAGGQLGLGFSDLAADFRQSLTLRTKILVKLVAALALGFAFILVALIALAMISSIFEVSGSLQS